MVDQLYLYPVMGIFLNDINVAGTRAQTTCLLGPLRRGARLFYYGNTSYQLRNLYRFAIQANPIGIISATHHCCVLYPSLYELLEFFYVVFYLDVCD